MLDAALASLDADVRRRARGRDRQRPRGGRGRASTTTARSRCPQGQTVTLREVPGAPRGGLRAGRPPPVPVVRSSWASSRRAPPASTRCTWPRAAPDDPRRGAAVRRRRRVRRHRRAGDRRARLRHRVDPARGRDRRARAACGCRRPSGRSSHVVGIDGFAGPSDLTVIATDGRRRRGARRSTSQAQAEHGEGSLTVAVSDDAGDPRRAARRARRCSRTTWRRRWRSPRRSRPSTCSSRARPPRRSRRACAPRAACSSATRPGPRSATTSRVRTTRCPTEGAARFASGLNVRHFRRRMAEVRAGRRRARAGRRRRADRGGRGLPGPRRLDGAARSLRLTPERPLAFADAADAAPASESTPVTRTAQLTARPARPTSRSRSACPAAAPAPATPGSASSTTCSTCWPATAGWTSTCKVTGDLQTGSHHTVEDTGIVLGQALDQALGDRRGIVRYGHAVVPMDEARAACAIDISGRPYALISGFERLPAGPHQRLRVRGRRGVLPRASPAPRG